MTIILPWFLFLLCYQGQGNQVSALWGYEHEPQFREGGAGWPMCKDTDACCKAIFPHWTDLEALHGHDGQAPIYSANAVIDAHNPLLVGFDCLDNRSFRDIASSGEPRRQGPLYMLCNSSERAQLYEKGERGDRDGEMKIELKASCEPLDERSQHTGIRSGSGSCRNIIARATGYSAIKAAIAKTPPIHAFQVNTAASRDVLVDQASKAAEGFSITISTLNAPEVNVYTEHNVLALTYHESMPGRTYRVCAKTPPGHGNWNLWLYETA